MDMKALGLVQTLLLALLLAGFSATANSQVVRKPNLSYQNRQAATEPSDLGVHAPSASEAIPNGNFEMGQTVWFEFSQLEFDIIGNSGFPSGIFPHGGSWLAWLAGEDYEISWVEQQITLPFNALALTYYHWIESIDVCPGPGLVNDVAKVSVDGTIIDEYDLCIDVNTSGWVQYQVDISSYAGQTVTIRIRADNDQSLYSSLFVDDVAIKTADSIFADGFESGDGVAWSGASPSLP